MFLLRLVQFDLVVGLDFALDLEADVERDLVAVVNLEVSYSGCFLKHCQKLFCAVSGDPVSRDVEGHERRVVLVDPLDYGLHAQIGDFVASEVEMGDHVSVFEKLAQLVDVAVRDVLVLNADLFGAGLPPAFDCCGHELGDICGRVKRNIVELDPCLGVVERGCGLVLGRTGPLLVRLEKDRLEVLLDLLIEDTLLLNLFADLLVELVSVELHRVDQHVLVRNYFLDVQQSFVADAFALLDG